MFIFEGIEEYSLYLCSFLILLGMILLVVKIISMSNNKLYEKFVSAQKTLQKM